MGKYSGTRSLFECFYEGQNRMGLKACQNISQLDGRNLQRIYLSKSLTTSDNNSISAGGCKYFSKALWSNLEIFYLSIIECKAGGNQIG